MKIYLAAQYSSMLEMREWRDLLQSHGHYCTSSWLTGEHNDPKRNAEYAILDLTDIDASSVVISKLLPPRTMSLSRGGRHVEFGYAIAKGKRLICIGNEPENVFHNLPQVELYPHLTAA